MPAPELTDEQRRVFDPYLLLPHTAGPDGTPMGLVEAWEDSEQTEAHLLAYCLLKDSSYRTLWDRLTLPDRATGQVLDNEAALTAVIDAGLIVEHHDPTVGLWPAGRPHLPRLDAPGHEDAVVVVLPGVFDPFHAGHAYAIETAYRTLTAQGVQVAACVAAPCHDGYASSKRHDWFPAAERIASVFEASVDVPVLLISQAETAAKAPLNFTTVLAAVTEDTGLRTVMVFGADNAGFAGAFTSPTEWVCVTRPGHEQAVPAGVAAVGGAGLKASSTDVHAVHAAHVAATRAAEEDDLLLALASVGPVGTGATGSALPGAGLARSGINPAALTGAPRA